MVGNPVFLWPLNSSLPLIVAVFRRISVGYTSRVSSLSVIQFTVAKSDFK